MGFRKMETFPTLWDEHNPCLVMLRGVTNMPLQKTKSTYNIQAIDDAIRPIVGENSSVTVVIDRKKLKCMLGIDLVYTKDNPDKHKLEFVSAMPFRLIREDGSKLHFALEKTTSESGHMKVGFRVYPVNEKLPHRMDFAYVRWI
jgi:hypothetical protein